MGKTGKDGKKEHQEQPGESIIQVRDTNGAVSLTSRKWEVAIGIDGLRPNNGGPEVFRLFTFDSRCKTCSLKF